MKYKKVTYGGVDVSQHVIRLKMDYHFNERTGSAEIEFTSQFDGIRGTKEFVIQRGIAPDKLETVFRGENLNTTNRKVPKNVISCADKMKKLLNVILTDEFASIKGSAMIRELWNKYVPDLKLVIDDTGDVLIKKIKLINVKFYNLIMDTASTYGSLFRYDPSNDTFYFTKVSPDKEPVLVRTGREISDIPKWTEDRNLFANKLLASGIERKQQKNKKFTSNGNAEQVLDIGEDFNEVSMLKGNVQMIPLVEYDVNYKDRTILVKNIPSGTEMEAIYTIVISDTIVVNNFDSQRLYGIESRNKNFQGSENVEDLRLRAIAYLSRVSKPFNICQVDYVGNKLINISDRISINDDVNDREGVFNVFQITLNWPSEVDIIKIGDKPFDLLEFRTSLSRRVKDLETKYESVATGVVGDLISTDETIFMKPFYCEVVNDRTYRFWPDQRVNEPFLSDDLATLANASLVEGGVSVEENGTVRGANIFKDTMSIRKIDVKVFTDSDNVQFKLFKNSDFSGDNLPVSFTRMGAALVGSVTPAGGYFRKNGSVNLVQWSSRSAVRNRHVTDDSDDVDIDVDGSSLEITPDSLSNSYNNYDLTIERVGKQLPNNCIIDFGIDHDFPLRYDNDGNEVIRNRIRIDSMRLTVGGSDVNSIINNVRVDEPESSSNSRNYNAADSFADVLDSKEFAIPFHHNKTNKSLTDIKFRFDFRSVSEFDFTNIEMVEENFFAPVNEFSYELKNATTFNPAFYDVGQTLFERNNDGTVKTNNTLTTPAAGQNGITGSVLHYTVASGSPIIPVATFTAMNSLVTGKALVLPKKLKVKARLRLTRGVTTGQSTTSEIDYEENIDNPNYLRNVILSGISGSNYTVTVLKLVLEDATPGKRLFTVGTLPEPSATLTVTNWTPTAKSTSDTWGYNARRGTHYGTLPEGFPSTITEVLVNVGNAIYIHAPTGVFNSADGIKLTSGDQSITLTRTSSYTGANNTPFEEYSVRNIPTNFRWRTAPVSFTIEALGTGKKPFTVQAPTDLKLPHRENSVILYSNGYKQITTTSTEKTTDIHGVIGEKYYGGRGDLERTPLNLEFDVPSSVEQPTNKTLLLKIWNKNYNLNSVLEEDTTFTITAMDDTARTIRFRTVGNNKLFKSGRGNSRSDIAGYDSKNDLSYRWFSIDLTEMQKIKKLQFNFTGFQGMGTLGAHDEEYRIYDIRLLDKDAPSRQILIKRLEILPS